MCSVMSLQDVSAMVHPKLNERTFPVVFLLVKWFDFLVCAAFHALFRGVKMVYTNTNDIRLHTKTTGCIPQCLCRMCP